MSVHKRVTCVVNKVLTSRHDRVLGDLDMRKRLANSKLFTKYCSAHPLKISFLHTKKFHSANHSADVCINNYKDGTFVIFASFIRATAVDLCRVRGSSQGLCHGVADLPRLSILMFTPTWLTIRSG